MAENKKKILLVDDDKFMQLAYKCGIEDAGFEFVSTDDGETVPNIIKSEKPDLIILDIIMEKKNGFDILENIKNDAETKNIPVWIFSNLQQKEDAEKGKALGADYFFSKVGFSRKDIINKLIAFLCPARA